MPKADQPEKVTCRKCQYTFAPSFQFDFYPDGKDLKVGLCERCMMTEAFAGKPSNGDPSPLPAGYETKVCKMGKGKATCGFLGATAPLRRPSGRPS